MDDMVPVRWERPGSRHHGVVHYVNSDLVIDLHDEAGKVKVLWPRKGKKGAEEWFGYKADQPCGSTTKPLAQTVPDSNSITKPPIKGKKGKSGPKRLQKQPSKPKQSGKKPASFVDVGSAPAEVNASVEKDSPNVPVFTTPTQNSVDKFNLFLSPSPTKCEHHQQLSKLEDKLDRVLDILEKKLGNESQPPPQPTDQGKTTQWFNKTPPPVLPPPQLPGPSYAPSSSIVSPQLSSDHDSILDDLCSILSDDVVNNPIHYFEPTGATPNNYGQYGQTAEQPNIAHNSMMNVQSVGTTHSHLPMETAAASSKPLLSPERAMTRFPGRDEKTLRALAVALARDCVFGTDVMLQSTPSGRGNNQTHQLDPEKLDYIKHIISRRMGKQPGNPEFELIWGKCVVSIGKQCQKLRTKAKKRM